MDENRGLWRGKRVDGGEWACGVPLQHCDGDWQLISGKVGAMIIDTIISETLGECTGLRDKNGKLIFEGDILRHNSGTLHEVVFEQRNDKAYFGWVIDKVETWQFDGDFLRQLEVVGNIHDNPELLKGDENNG